MTINTTRRGAIATVAGGAVALTGTAAAYAYEPTLLDPAVAVAAEWTSAKDNLLELMDRRISNAEREQGWTANVLALSEAGYRLGEVQATTLAGAAAVLAVAVQSLEPSNLTILHSNLGSHRVMLAWVRSAKAAIDNVRQAGHPTGETRHA